MICQSSHTQITIYQKGEDDLDKQYNLKEYRRKDECNFKVKKDNMIESLKEVECFLWNWKKACKGIGLYKILKK